VVVWEYTYANADEPDAGADEVDSQRRECVSVTGNTWESF
jgi:hypothetical protein